MDVYIVTLSDFYSYRLIGKLTVFFAVSGVQSTQSNLGVTWLHFHPHDCSDMGWKIKEEVGQTGETVWVWEVQGMISTLIC